MATRDAAERKRVKALRGRSADSLYSVLGSNFGQEQPSALWMRRTVVRRISIWPASIFWTVRGFKSASSANRSWVMALVLRSLRTLAPNFFNCASFSRLMGTAH
jgi:hypothetical protein